MGKGKVWAAAVASSVGLAGFVNCVGDSGAPADASPDVGSVDSAKEAAASDASNDAFDSGPAPACDLKQPFGAPVLLTDAINSAQNDEGVWFAPDLLTVYVTSNRGDGGITNFWIYSGVRASIDAGFTSMFPSPHLNSVAAGYGSQGAVVTGDGKTIYFATGATGTYAAWTATRTSTAADFDVPAQLASPINLAGTENFPSWVTPDGTTLYFVTTRDGSRDIYTATRSGNGGFNAPTPLSAVNTSGSETGIVLSADELQAVLTRGAKLYYTQRATISDGFSVPIEITELNAFASPLGASWLSADGCSVYFDAPTDAGTYHMYLATRGH